MSFQSNDERIEQLEQTSTALLEAVRGLFKIQQGLNKRYDLALVHQYRSHGDLLRFIASTSSSIDEATKKRLLEETSAQEKQCAELEVFVEQMDKPLAAIALLLPPLDGSQPPRQF